MSDWLDRYLCDSTSRKRDVADAYGFPIKVGRLPREVKALVHSMQAAVRPHKTSYGDLYYPRPRHGAVTVHRARWGHYRRFEVWVEHGNMDVTIRQA